jgi:hypothetical protein
MIFMVLQKGEIEAAAAGREDRERAAARVM